MSQTLDALAAPNIIAQFTEFPTEPEEINRKQREFMAIGNSPRIVEVIDGTRVKIVAP